MNLRTEYEAGRLIVYLAGELDQHEARCAYRSLRELLDEYLPRDVVLDLGELTFMDSSGIALLIRVNRCVKEMGGRFWVDNPGAQPRRVMETAGIGRLVPVASKSI